MESPVPVKPSNPVPNDRLFFVLPNYLMVEGPNRVPSLPVKTKFLFTAKTMSDPVTISFLGGIALIGQARDSAPIYGQGLKGYGKRYAAVYADTGIGTLMTASVFPMVLHQDPRYFQLGSGGFRRRTLYALSRIFVTRGDSGMCSLTIPRSSVTVSPPASRTCTIQKASAPLATPWASGPATQC